MLKRLFVASCLVSLVACVQKDDAPEGIAGALPSAEQVSIQLPQQSERAVGQLATWYVATRDITKTFNGGTGWVLLLLGEIVKYPVTTASGDTFTWGPWSEPLEPAEYKLEVRVVGDGTYTYQLSGRSKLEDNATFEVVIDGASDPRKGDRLANGHFLLDFDAGHRIDPSKDDDAKGSMDVRYDLSARHLDLTIMSTDLLGQPVLADYAYNQAADGRGGDMTFGLAANAGGGPANESAQLRSRWNADGAGRADGLVSGGDLGALQATASECWDTRFKRVFYTDSAVFSATEGLVTACAFADADVPAPR